jgi:hypothetical protein
MTNQTPEYSTENKISFPVLLNTWKHHAGALRQAIAEAVRAGEPGLQTLAGQLIVIGTELMDLYVGPLSPVAIADRVLQTLRADNRLSLDAYRAWLQQNGGYAVLTFPEDHSRWVLRLGDEADRYVHVHPARWAPETLRVRANVLKTAVLVLAYIGIHGGDPLDLTVLNEVRRQFLGLSPLGKVAAGDQGIAAVLDVLRTPMP